MASKAGTSRTISTATNSGLLGCRFWCILVHDASASRLAALLPIQKHRYTVLIFFLFSDPAWTKRHTPSVHTCFFSAMPHVLPSSFASPFPDPPPPPPYTKGSGAVKEEVGDSPASEGAAGGSGSKGKSGAGAGAGASGLPIEDLAFDQGLRRMRAGKIGKVCDFSLCVLVVGSLTVGQFGGEGKEKGKRCKTWRGKCSHLKRDRLRRTQKKGIHADRYTKDDKKASQLDVGLKCSDIWSSLLSCTTRWSDLALRARSY